MSEQLATGDAPAPPTSGNTLAVVGLAVGAGAAGAALLPFTGMIAAPLGAVALALGVVAIAEAERRGRRSVAIAGTALGALALLAGVAWALAMFGGFSLFGMATGHSSDMGMAQESATLEAAPGPTSHLATRRRRPSAKPASTGPARRRFTPTRTSPRRSRTGPARPR